MKIIHVAGARPNFMKLAPILRELRNIPNIHSILLHTGQHYDANMSDVFFEEPFDLCARIRTSNTHTFFHRFP